MVTRFATRPTKVGKPASRRLAPRLGVEELEGRDVPAVLTETTTLGWWYDSTASLTVTVSEVSDRYQWDYHLVNNDVDFLPDDPYYQSGSANSPCTLHRTWSSPTR